MARIGSSQPVALAGSLDALAEDFDLTHFGAAPTKFDEADLWPLTANVLQEMDVAEMAGTLAELGVPDDLARDVWEVARANITRRSEVAEWWQLFRDGATPLVDDEDKDFVAKAFSMLPDPPYGPETWADWTSAVKAATGRKGKALFMPLRKAVTGRQRGPEMADVMRLLQKKPTF
jgi:glutamyl-tRNA synthetase